MGINKNKYSRIVTARRLSPDKLKEMMLNRLEKALNESIFKDIPFLIDQYSWLRSDLSPVYALIKHYDLPAQALMVIRPSVRKAINHK